MMMRMTINNRYPIPLMFVSWFLSSNTLTLKKEKLILFFLILPIFELLTQLATKYRCSYFLP